MAVLVQTQPWPTPDSRSFRPRMTSTLRAPLTRRQLHLHRLEMLAMLPESVGMQTLLPLLEPKTAVSKRATKSSLVPLKK